MLGKLFNTLDSSSRRNTAPKSHLESVTENSHTIGLLFPDNSVAVEHDGVGQPFPTADWTGGRRHGTINDHGLDGLDLNSPRDIRILIAQGRHAGSAELLLFDSKPSPPPESPKIRHARVPSRGETVSGGVTGRTGRAAGVSPIQEDIHHRRTSSTLSAGPGAFQRARLRKGSISSIHSLDETLPLRPGKETDDIDRIALGCMFENAQLNYKGTGFKMHIIPLASKPYESSICSTSLTTDYSSVPPGRQPLRRPSSLSKSLTPADPLNLYVPSPEPEAPPQHPPRRRTVLVTRTFSVAWVDDEVSHNDLRAPQSPVSPRKPLYSSSAPIGDVQTPNVRPSRMQVSRPPTYAITIILQLPIAPTELSPPVSRTGTFGRRALRKDSSSYQSYASLGSSFDSERRGAWSAVDPFFNNDAATTASINSDVDDRVDLIGQHWDVIERTLTTFQAIAQKKILEQIKPLSRMRRPLKLPAQALANDSDLKAAADRASMRVVRGLRIPRVRTGHGRWSVWREEARWLSNWGGGRDENFFFLILLTAFLGTHNNWICSVAPKWHRRRYREQFQNLPSTEVTVPNRTLIISDDKMAARRLIFLLSAFLPANGTTRGDSSPLRPSTSASRAYSQSPPSHIPLLRQESLRRTINRRGKAIAPHMLRRQSSRASSITAPSESHDDRTETGTIRPPGSDGFSRRSSETRSLMRSKASATDLVMLDASNAKASSTVQTIPVENFVRPHFSRQNSAQGPFAHSRTSSTASTTLLSPTQRRDSSGSESQWGSRWGSLRSLWTMGSRRETTGDYFDTTQSTDEGLGIVGVRTTESKSKLQQMVEEVQGMEQVSVADGMRTSIPQSYEAVLRFQWRSIRLQQSQSMCH
jgi:hypothetical protein